MVSIMAKLTAWDRLTIVRNKNRPTIKDYIPLIFDDYYEMHGDRYYGDDKAITGGIATINGIAVTIIAQVKGRSIEENKESNFSMPHPEGYRKALRLAKQAEKFHRYRIHSLGHLHDPVRHDGMDHRRPACEFRPGSDACGDGCCLCRRADVLLRLHGQ